MLGGTDDTSTVWPRPLLTQTRRALNTGYIRQLKFNKLWCISWALKASPTGTLVAAALRMLRFGITVRVRVYCEMRLSAVR